MKYLVLLFLLSTLFLMQLSHGQMSQKQWVEDIDFVQSELEIGHANIYHSISKDSLSYYFDNLKKRLGNLKDKEITFELTKILAKIGDGHTGYGLHTNEYKDSLVMPLNLRKLSNDIVVINAIDEYKSLIGLKLVRLGKYPIAQIEKMTADYILHDNEYGRNSLIEKFIRLGSFINYLGIKINNESVEATFQNNQGEVELISLKLSHPEEILNISGPSNKYSGIRWLRNSELKFYDETINDSFLYIQLNSSDIRNKEEIGEFSKKLMAQVSEKTISKIVLDLRLNRGGSIKNTMPLLKALISIDLLYPEKKLFVLIGNITFCAGADFAEKLDIYTDAIFIGEPTGGKPSGYGDLGFLTLPNSKIRIRYSRLSAVLDGWETRPAIFPDMIANITYSNLITQTDPALEIVKSYIEQKSVVEELSTLLTTDKLSEFIEAYRQLKEEHYNDFVFNQHILNRIAVNFYRQKDLESALKILELNAQEYPWSPLAHSNLGEIYIEVGNKDKGMKSLKKAFELHKGYDAWRKLINQ